MKSVPVDPQEEFDRKEWRGSDAKIMKMLLMMGVKEEGKVWWWRKDHKKHTCSHESVNFSSGNIVDIIIPSRKERGLNGNKFPLRSFR